MNCSLAADHGEQLAEHEGKFNGGVIFIMAKILAARTIGLLQTPSPDMNEAVANMVSLAGVSLAESLHMASGVPAAVLGLGHAYGSIAERRPASLTCLAGDLTPEAVYVHGCRSPA